MTIDRCGQNAESTFRAAAGDDLSLGFGDNTFTTSLYVTVFAPSGVKVLNDVGLMSGSTRAFKLPDLPEDGLYRVVIDPYLGAAGTVRLTLSADVVSALTADGPAQSAAITRPGQQIRAEFTAPDAKVFGFALTDSTLARSGDAYLVGPAGGEGTYLGYVSAHSPVAFYITGVTPGSKYAVVITPDNVATGPPSCGCRIRPPPASCRRLSRPSAVTSPDPGSSWSSPTTRRPGTERLSCSATAP